MPSWVSPIAANRSFFQDTVLVARAAGAEVGYFKVLYAVRNPLYLALSPLKVLEEYVNLSEPMG
eukprot:6947730-Lingulodinium_polyedra.AAC.1